MAELSQLNASTLEWLGDRGDLLDNVFQRDPLLAYLRRNVQRGFPGGSKIWEQYIYDGLNGGGFATGGNFNVTGKQTQQRLEFDPKKFYVNITVDKLVVKGLNRGPQALFSILDSEFENAFLTMGAHQAIGLYLPGQGQTNYENNFDGLAEALNDGSTNSWNGSAYTTYGTITRSSTAGTAGAAIRSVPVDVSGEIEYNTLETQYSNCSFGDGDYEPNIGLTTYLGYSYIKQKFQTQQRFVDTQDPNIGFNGLKFNNATILKSRYAPGTAISASAMSEAVTYLTETTGGNVTAYPTLTAETFWWLNAREKFMRLYISDEKEFAYGFTGFKPAQDNLSLVGQIICLGNLTVRGNRYHRQLYGITG